MQSGCRYRGGQVGFYGLFLWIIIYFFGIQLNSWPILCPSLFPAPSGGWILGMARGDFIWDGLQGARNEELAWKGWNLTLGFVQFSFLVQSEVTQTPPEIQAVGC